MLRFLASIVCLALLSSAPAYARTEGGDLLWQDQHDFAGGEDIAMAMAAADGRVVVVGSVQAMDGGTDLMVRAYDGKSGALLWDDQVDRDGGDDKAVAV